MPYGGYTYTPLQKYIANFGLGNGTDPIGPGANQYYAKDDGAGNIGQYTNPNYGLDEAGIANKVAGGQSLSDWFNSYLASQKAIGLGQPDYDPSHLPTLMPDGNVRQQQYIDAPDPSGNAMMAVLAAVFGGASGLAAGAAGGAAEGGAAGTAGGLGSSTAGVGGLEYGAGAEIGGAGATTGAGAMDLGDWQDWSGLMDGGGSPVNYGDYVGDIPTTGGGGTSIYGANPSVSDLYSQYQLSGQSPMDFLKNLSGLPNTPPGAQSLIQQALKSGGQGLDMTKLLGQLAATGLGIYGANRQASQIGALSQQYAGYGAPYRAMLAQSYADPNGFLANSPDIQASVKQGTDALARSLSTGGNPTGSGAALQQLQNYATQGLYGQLGNERNRLANFGGLSNFNAAAPGLAGQQITAQGGALNALGSGISSITNPPTTLEQALNALNSNNFKPGNGTVV